MKNIRRFLWAESVKQAKKQCKNMGIAFSPLMWTDNNNQLRGINFDTYTHDTIFFNPKRVDFDDVLQAISKHVHNPKQVSAKILDPIKENCFQEVVSILKENHFHGSQNGAIVTMPVPSNKTTDTLWITHYAASLKNIEVTYLWVDAVDQKLRQSATTFYVDEHRRVHEDDPWKLGKANSVFTSRAVGSAWFGGSVWGAGGSGGGGSAGGTSSNGSGLGGAASSTVTWTGGNGGGGNLPTKP